MVLCSYKVLTIKNKMVRTYIQEKWRDLKKNNHKMQLPDQENDIYIYIYNLKTKGNKKITHHTNSLLPCNISNFILKLQERMEPEISPNNHEDANKRSQGTHSLSDAS